MIYLFFVGVTILVIATVVTIYCLFAYSAMLDDIDVHNFDPQESGQSKMAVGLEIDLYKKST
jgi:hypothetical protein